MGGQDEVAFPERVRARAQEHLDGYLADLQRVVDIDSGTFDKAGVDRVGRVLADMLRGLGAEVTTVPQRDLGDHLVARLRGRGARRLMLLGHFDTVYPAGTAAERPFRVERGRLRGPAVMDMKGGLILGIHALRLLGEIGFDDFAEIAFVMNTDEEIGSPTSRALIEATAASADAVLVLEPGKAPGGVVSRRKGVGMYELTVEGRAAHAGAAPQEGRNANVEMAHKIVAIDALNDVEAGTTVAPNVLRGGERRNVIAARAMVEIDVRVASQSEATRVDEALRAIAVRSWVPDTRAVLTGGLNRPPMEPTRETEGLLAVAREAAASLGLEFVELASGGGSDGNFTAALGVPTLDGLGPVGFHAHSPDEYAERDSIPDRLAFLTLLLLRAPRRQAG